MRPTPPLSHAQGCPHMEAVGGVVLKVRRKGCGWERLLGFAVRLEALAGGDHAPSPRYGRAPRAPCAHPLGGLLCSHQEAPARRAFAPAACELRSRRASPVPESAVSRQIHRDQTSPCAHGGSCSTHPCQRAAADQELSSRAPERGAMEEARIIAAELQSDFCFVIGAHRTAQVARGGGSTRGCSE